MRKIGSFENVEKAEDFRWYLVSQGVETQVEDFIGDLTDVWVMQDRDLPRARQLLTEFEANPGAFAKQIEESREQHKLKTLTKKPQPISRPDTQTYAPLNARIPYATYVFMALSILYFLMTFVDRDRWLLRHLMISEDFVASSLGFKSFRELMQGQVWRLLTPIFIHSNFFHIGFNMIWLYQLGRVIEGHIRSVRFILLVCAIAIPSNLIFYLISGPFFGGMSGVVYGLFFYTWAYDRYSARSPFRMDPYLFKFFLVYYAICCVSNMFGIHIANTIHGFGGFMGLCLGYLSSGHFKLNRKTIRIDAHFINNTLIIIVLLVAGIIADLLTR